MPHGKTESLLPRRRPVSNPQPAGLGGGNSDTVEEEDDDDDENNNVEAGDEESSLAFAMLIRNGTAINNPSDCIYCIKKDNIHVYFQSFHNIQSQKAKNIHRNFSVPEKYTAEVHWRR